MGNCAKMGAENASDSQMMGRGGSGLRYALGWLGVSWETPTGRVRGEYDGRTPIDDLVLLSGAKRSGPSSHKPKPRLLPDVAIRKERVRFAIHPVRVTDDHQATIARELQLRAATDGEARKYLSGNAVDQAELPATAAATGQEKGESIREVRCFWDVIAEVAYASRAVPNIWYDSLRAGLDLGE